MENTEQQKQETPLHDQLAVWLKDHGVQLAIHVQTPRGELISPDNFIPAGWSVTVNLVGKK